MRKYVPAALCCAVVLILSALAPGCCCLEGFVEEGVETFFDGLIDSLFPDGEGKLVLDPIVVDYPANDGEPVCVTTSITNELNKIGAEVGPGDWERLWLNEVFQSYSDASWSPSEVEGVNCTVFLVDENGEVNLDWPTIDRENRRWFHSNFTHQKVVEFFEPHLQDWDMEFQACVQCDDETDEHHFEYLLMLEVLAENTED